MSDARDGDFSYDFLLILHDHRRANSESCHILLPDFSTWYPLRYRPESKNLTQDITIYIQDLAI